MNACVLLTALLAASTPPLPPQLIESQHERLTLANDGGDYQEEAFLAILENVRAWTIDNAGAVFSLPESSMPQAGDLLKNPAAHRGELVVVRGVLQQQAPLGPGFDGVHEWFVRDANGRPLIVYVAKASNSQDTWRDGQRVEIPARFYKVVQAVARDGSVQRYPAFVGAFARVSVQTAATSDLDSRWLLVVPIGAMLVVFFVLSRWVKSSNRLRQRQGPSPRRFDLTQSPEVDDAASLPDDPADALAELKRRAAENR